MDEERAFGGLLKRYRRVAHLTQEDLAERAGYSSHYVSMLERSVRFPQPLTVDTLADALVLPDADRATLHAAATPRLPAALLAGRPERSVAVSTAGCSLLPRPQGANSFASYACRATRHAILREGGPPPPSTLRVSQIDMERESGRGGQSWAR